MIKKTRRNYTNEFKEEAVKLVTEQGYALAEAALNLGLIEAASTAAMIFKKSWP